MATYEVRLTPVEFAAVRRGTLKHIIRPATRDYGETDLLLLREWDSAKAEYTSRETVVTVTWVTKGPVSNLPEDLVVMSIQVAATSDRRSSSSMRKAVIPDE